MLIYERVGLRERYQCFQATRGVAGAGGVFVHRDRACFGGGFLLAVFMTCNNKIPACRNQRIC